MEKLFQPTIYWAGNYLSTLGLKLIHVSKRGPYQKELLYLYESSFVELDEVQSKSCVDLKQWIQMADWSTIIFHTAPQ